jgi:hypothetical protein
MNWKSALQAQAGKRITVYVNHPERNTFIDVELRALHQDYLIIREPILGDDYYIAYDAIVMVQPSKS